ncbi:esterase [Bordetella genomosp. 12]|uniref:Esterase n=1 Tax=Bordetella genomosp. 12 TaxID=463035 RepID=A0A261V9V6_9BORD|nr:esterase [Bordetella genomosp. 12]OZI70899.1 esterase [Bordetella genomosp. 12]
MRAEEICLRSISSFFVGGDTAVIEGLPVEHRSMVLNGYPREVDPNGEHVYGQMYVQHYRQARPRHPHPVLLWHGGGMTGCTWESTPDGRDGWLMRFLQAGYDVLVSDAVERGRSSWARFPEIYKTAPVFRPKKEGWINFRLGPQYGPGTRVAYPGQQFPVEAFDAFAQQWVPRWPGHEAMILAAYEALVRRVGPCHIVAHSQGAGFAAEVARRLPASVVSVVGVEPGGMPEPQGALALPRHLVVWGDYIECSGPHWQTYRAQADAYLASVAAGTEIAVLDLPAHGIHGNSHLPMMDRNSDSVFERIRAWIEQ